MCSGCQISVTRGGYRCAVAANLTHDYTSLKTIDLVYFNAGGGHRSAAKALETVIREQNRPWRVRLVNLFEVLDPQSLFRKTTGIYPEDIYNTRLAHGWTFGLAQELKLLQAMIRIGHRIITRRLQRHWRGTRPDMVVSLVPNFNRSMYEALAMELPAVPYVTILTDMADYPPHFWVEPNQPQHVICGTPKAAFQARAVSPQRSIVHETSGMIIRPDFYRALTIDRRSEMRKLGLDAERPTGMVMFGGHGSKSMQRIAEHLHDTQLILICGHNSRLAAELRRLPAQAPRCVVQYTQDIRHYMALSDFFIGKPGPGSVSEAIHQGLPVIVVRNAYTMPQERYNTDWILENGIGVVLKSFADVRRAIAEVLLRLPEFQSNIERVRNRAVFEIPDILDDILTCRAPDSVQNRVCRAPNLSATHAPDNGADRCPAPATPLRTESNPRLPSRRRRPHRSAR